MGENEKKNPEKVLMTYIGPSPARRLPAAGVTAKRGEPVEVPADYAKTLAKHPDWIQGEPPAKPKKSK